jgi:hypothetical protein
MGLIGLLTSTITLFKWLILDIIRPEQDPDRGRGGRP